MQSVLRVGFNAPLAPNKTKALKKRNVPKKNESNACCGTKIQEFCKRTDLHGYKYTVMDELNIIERCCWIVAVIVSTILAVFFVITAYQWYARNPIITVIESTQGAIWDIPFPAVTICDLNIISRRAARRFANELTLPSNVTADQVFEMLRLTPTVHSMFTVSPENKQALRLLQQILDLNHVSLDSLFKQLSPVSSCNRLLQRCMWKNTMYRCDALFQHVFTYFSLCCTFNYFAFENPTQDIQASELVGADQPRRVASCGYQTALTVLMHIDAEDYYSTQAPSVGALVFIDNSYHIPDLDSQVRLINPSTELLVAVSPESTYSTPGIRAFRVPERMCYFNDEVEMDSFRYYSYHNCMVYRRIQIIKRHCECVPFYYPDKGTESFLRTCNFNDIDCLDSIIEKKMENPDKLSDPSQLGRDQAFQCLPECEHYDYPLEVALGKLALDARVEGIPFFHDVVLANRSLVNVFFNDLVSTRYRRDAYLNWQNLLASFGGLLSLMLGFTLISGFDLALFFTFGIAYEKISTTKGRPPYDDRLKNLQILNSHKIVVTERLNNKIKPLNKAAKRVTYGGEDRDFGPYVAKYRHRF